MHAKAPRAEPAPDSALARLLATEARLETMLAECRAVAEARVRDAEAGAARRLGDVETELLDATHEMEARLARERRERLASATARATAALAAFEQLNDATVATLADWVVTQVIGSAGGEG
jgi:vacuolar-type H+-ATPase subunit H